MSMTIPPTTRQMYPRLTSIVDCFEIFIEKPKTHHVRAQTYSQYKKHTTVKVFIACSPLGAVTYLSPVWGGRASDVEIVRKSGFISPNLHLPGDQILADRGFTLKEDFASQCGAALLYPAFTKGRNQMTAREVEQSRKLSSVRIHIERVIGLMRNRYTILQGTLPLSLLKSAKDEAMQEPVSSREVEQSRKLSSVRIHIERVIGLMRNRYTILQGTLPLSLLKSAKDEAMQEPVSSIDKIVTCCADLTNLGDGIVYREFEEGEELCTD